VTYGMGCLSPGFHSGCGGLDSNPGDPAARCTRNHVISTEHLIPLMPDGISESQTCVVTRAGKQDTGKQGKLLRDMHQGTNRERRVFSHGQGSRQQAPPRRRQRQGRSDFLACDPVSELCPFCAGNVCFARFLFFSAFPLCCSLKLPLPQT
jgi:hypothetical protein